MKFIQSGHPLFTSTWNVTWQRVSFMWTMGGRFWKCNVIIECPQSMKMNFINFVCIRKWCYIGAQWILVIRNNAYIVENNIKLYFRNVYLAVGHAVFPNMTNFLHNANYCSAAIKLKSIIPGWKHFHEYRHMTLCSTRIICRNWC